MSSRRQGPKVIKKTDGDPLTRQDLQFDLLHAIFSDQHQVFTDPFPNGSRPAGSKVTFRDLYVNAIYNSPKASKILKEKMVDIPEFATDFAMMTLLANVGRINTTMSFFVEMKTTIRTYHPIPALQKTSGSLQDAPRLKAIAKASLLEDETTSPPNTLADILARAKSGRIPSTSVNNLIFTLTNESSAISQQYLSNEVDFADLFLPIAVSSLSRARVFLWLCYHHLEAPSSTNDDDYDSDATVTENPFSDSNRPGKAPALIMLTPEEVALENVDPDDEKQLGDKLITQRAQFVQAQSAKESNKSGNKAAGDDAESVVSVDSVKPKTARTPKEKKNTKSSLAHAEMGAETNDGSVVMHSREHLEEDVRRKVSGDSRSRTRQDQLKAVQDKSSRRYAPYKNDVQRRPYHRTNSPPRSLLQQAWHVFTHCDPLCDSDDESEYVDEHYRQDYLQKLSIISRLRGKSPTPELEDLPIAPVAR
ncbi:hypothetical protein K435DRAFT_724244 [Dendrothele bispora CBS 962.96]|uniref:Ino eighty subunit 1 n=1 Tax=Dendrothele bispora (strain CBS 962.96) TaxID=1314807 RepID=A0A4S8LYQ7_DENBC|nr:hypothetical protein K435DRAFT_724244 [Dendrothele bispora CBS 962.96]